MSDPNPELLTYPGADWLNDIVTDSLGSQPWRGIPGTQYLIQ
jgi:hypothetical protein